MILSTTDSVPRRETAAILGLVRGSSVRACALPHDAAAALKNLVGGEITEYTKLLAEAREQALDRMLAQAGVLGADAVLGVRFCSSEIASGAAELLVYGTAVRLSPPA